VILENEVGGKGLESSANIAEKTSESASSAALALHLGSKTAASDHEKARLDACWDHLSAAVKAAILKLVDEDAARAGG
jgi:hypothetical protein